MSRRAAPSRSAAPARRSAAVAAPAWPGLTGAPWFALLAVAAVVWGVAGAWRTAWLSDDAFISFRYAENLVRGLGLVFNAGERVEGYSNFLWTLWVALGMRLGADPEGWSVFWGLACHAGSLALLALLTRRFAGGAGTRAVVPVAAVLAALHPAWARFATSGLETSLFTFLALLGFFAVTSRAARAPAVAGAVFALLALTRPDGPVLALPAGLHVLLARRSRVRSALAFAAAFAVLWLPYTLWRVSYYGEFLPNTYHAKSAALAWWDQGGRYLGLYALKYWPLLLGAAFGVAGLLVRRPARTADDGAGDDGAVAAGLLALAMLVLYALYVARVGGDFMFARFLVPVTPFLLVLADLGCQRLLGRRPLAVAGVTAALALGVLVTPDPIRGAAVRDGITNEWALYTPEFSGRVRGTGETLRPYLEGLPARMAVLGAEARAVYYSRVPTAIECTTGLTDRAIARQPLARRGRVGHEKRATADLLLGPGRANLVMSLTELRALGLESRVPLVPVAMGGHAAMLLRWEPALVEGLRARGARVFDLPAALDDYLAASAARPDSEVVTLYRKVKPFYLDPTGDRVREAAFLRRLGGAAAGTPALR